MSLCTQLCAYLVTNAALAFQSPFCRAAPANNEQIISYMQQQHTHYAWASFWIGNSIIFKTQGRIIVGDPGAIVMRTGNLGRMPEYQEEVLHADRPSLLVFIRHGDPHPLLQRVLTSTHVMYRAARFSSEPGIDLLLVTPLNRTVSLLESDAFKTIFSACPSRFGQDIQGE